MSAICSRELGSCSKAAVRRHMVEYGLLEMGFASFFFLRKFTPQKSTKGSKMLIDGEEGNDFIVSPRIFSWVADPTCILWLRGHFQLGNPSCRSSRFRKFQLVQKSNKLMERRIHGGLLNIKPPLSQCCRSLVGRK